MSSSSAKIVRGGDARRRLPREERYRQLLEVAWRLVREEGTDLLSLGRLAEQAGVTKPVVYSHFPSRAELLAALYREYDARQHALMDSALEAGAPTLEGRAAVIASTYMGCVLAQGREIPGVTAALAGSPELERVKREGDAGFLEKCRAALAPFAGPGGVPSAGLRAMLGAAEALSSAATTGELGAEEAEEELAATITAMIARSGGGG